MKIYVDSKKKVEDTRSSALSLTIIGGLGIFALLLINLGIIPISFIGTSKIMINVVMGILFLIFLIIGICSFLSLKNLQSQASLETALEQEITDWFLSTYKDSLQTIPVGESEEEGQEESLYFTRYEKINGLLLAKYPDLSEEKADHLIEELYGQIYSFTASGK